MKLQLLAVSAIASQAAFGEQARKTTPPAAGPIAVAFVITEGATMIDFAGPWEVFQDVMVGEGMPFRLYTVSDSKAPLRIRSSPMCRCSEACASWKAIRSSSPRAVSARGSTSRFT
jgi:hypothetical protein